MPLATRLDEAMCSCSCLRWKGKGRSSREGGGDDERDRACVFDCGARSGGPAMPEKTQWTLKYPVFVLQERPKALHWIRHLCDNLRFCPTSGINVSLAKPESSIICDYTRLFDKCRSGMDTKGCLVRWCPSEEPYPVRDGPDNAMNACRGLN